MALTADSAVLLTRPSRGAGLPFRFARIVLALVVIVLVALVATSRGGGDDGAVAAIHIQTVEAMETGDDYYPAAVAAVRAVGTPGVATVPLPLLAVMEARLPPFVLLASFCVLLAIALWVWWGRIGALTPRVAPHAAGIILVIVGLVASTRLLGDDPQVAWSGVLVALSLGLRSDARWIESTAVGICAALFSPIAALYLIVMAGCAIATARPRVAIGWIVALLIVAGALVAHRHAVATFALAVVPAVESDNPRNLAALVRATFAPLPLPVGALLFGLALLGWAMTPGALAVRSTTLIVIATLATLLLGPVGGTAPALLLVAIVPVGLLFAPDAIRDLIRAALDRRRFTVTRKAR